MPDAEDIKRLFEEKLDPELLVELRKVGQCIKGFMQEVRTPGKTEWLLNAMHEFGYPPSFCVAVVMLMTLDGIILMNDDRWIFLAPEHQADPN